MSEFDGIAIEIMQNKTEKQIQNMRRKSVRYGTTSSCVT